MHPLASDHLRLILPHDTAPMNTPSYQIGDRVRLSQPCFGMPAGTKGVITFIYHVAHNLYRVHFDTFNIACTIHSSGFVGDPLKTEDAAP